MCLMMNENLSSEIMYRGPSANEQVRASVNLSRVRNVRMNLKCVCQ